MPSFLVIDRFDNDCSDEDLVKWSKILRGIQETGISTKAANRLTPIIASLIGSDIPPLSLEEVEALIHERGLESTME